MTADSFQSYVRSLIFQLRQAADALEEKLEEGTLEEDDMRRGT